MRRYRVVGSLLGNIEPGSYLDERNAERAAAQEQAEQALRIDAVVWAQKKQPARGLSYEYMTRAEVERCERIMRAAARIAGAA